jgi:uncharacterized alkaline shock family protein YloU
MADTLAVQNEYGSITITKSILAQIVSEVIGETSGVRLAGYKRMLTGGRSNMEVSFDDDGIPEIKAYVVVKFGASISGVTYEMINEMKNRINAVIDRPPSSISITVVGTETKKSVIKRNIEVKRSYDITDR